MKHFILILLTLISSTYANAQASAIQWAKTFGSIGFEEAHSIVQTTDGGYVIAGSANYNNGDVTGDHLSGTYDIWVVKISSTGILQWQKSYGGSADDFANCIQKTSDGGFIIAGSSVSTDGDVTGLHIPNPNNPLWGDYWVIKIDSSGILQWQKCLGGTGTDVAQSITQTTDGGYVVVGESYASGDGDFVNGGNIIKLSSTGDIVWNAYQNGNYNYCVNQTNDGGYIVIGWLLGKFNILKLDSEGIHQWQKFYGGSSGNDVAKSVIQTIDGGYMVVGNVQSSDGDVTAFHGGNSDAWLLKLDNSGTLEWQKTLGGLYADEAYSVQQTADGGYIIAGLSNSNDGDVSGLHGLAGDSGNSGPISDYWIIKTNSTGSIQWQKMMGGNYIDRATCIINTTDGGYAVAGHTALKVVNSGDVTGFHLNTQVINASGYDFWIVKLAPDILSLNNNLNNNLITVYPNPTSNLIHISGLTTTECNIKIINELGNTVANYINTTSRDLDISNLADGIYFLSIENSYFKIIKK